MPAVCASTNLAVPNTAITWEMVCEAAATDEECTTLVETIMNGFPPKENLPDIIVPFHSMRDSLYSIRGVPFKDHKMLIPKSLRPQVIEALHAGHQGINAILATARQILFWPGLDQLRLRKRQCYRCNESAPSLPREPLSEPPCPEFPFEQVVADFFFMQGNDYLIYADRYTGWVEIKHMTSKAAKAVCTALRNWFITYGVPVEIGSDGGPPYESMELRTFLKDWGVKQRISSAYYPQSNGRAELAVKSAKRILAANVSSTGHLDIDSAARALLLLRNTPVQDVNMSPSEMLFGHTLKDHLPSAPVRMRHEWSQIADAREEGLAKRHLRSQERYNSHTSQLEPLAVGDIVAIQNQRGNAPKRWQNTGTIVSTNIPARQYEVKIDGSRRVTRRNRRFLRKIDPVCCKPSYISETPLRPSYTPNGNVNMIPPIQQNQSDSDIQPSTAQIEAPSAPSSLQPASPITPDPKPIPLHGDRSHTPQRNTLPMIKKHLSSETFPQDQIHETPGTIPSSTTQQLRRSTRVRREPQRYTP